MPRYPDYPISVRTISGDMDIPLYGSTFCLFPVERPMGLVLIPPGSGDYVTIMSRKDFSLRSK